tara:strand:+ start:817 stop:1050 length:234 start_codon:yes stop_codon:yes gene_type:complete
MELKKNKETKVNSLPDNDREELLGIINKLEQLKGKDSSEITEESLDSLESIIFDLLNMQNRHQRYYRRWLKQGYLAD